MGSSLQVDVTVHTVGMYLYTSSPVATHLEKSREGPGTHRYATRAVHTNAGQATQSNDNNLPLGYVFYNNRTSMLVSIHQRESNRSEADSIYGRANLSKVFSRRLSSVQIDQPQMSHASHWKPPSLPWHLSWLPACIAA